MASVPYRTDAIKLFPRGCQLKCQICRGIFQGLFPRFPFQPKHYRTFGLDSVNNRGHRPCSDSFKYLKCNTLQVFGTSSLGTEAIGLLFLGLTGNRGKKVKQNFKIVILIYFLIFFTQLYRVVLGRTDTISPLLLRFFLEPR